MDLKTDKGQTSNKRKMKSDNDDESCNNMDTIEMEREFIPSPQLRRSNRKRACVVPFGQVDQSKARDTLDQVGSGHEEKLICNATSSSSSSRCKPSSSKSTSPVIKKKKMTIKDDLLTTSITWHSKVKDRSVVDQVDLKYLHDIYINNWTSNLSQSDLNQQLLSMVQNILSEDQVEFLTHALEDKLFIQAVFHTVPVTGSSAGVLYDEILKLSSPGDHSASVKVIHRLFMQRLLSSRCCPLDQSYGSKWKVKEIPALPMDNTRKIFDDLNKRDVTDSLSRMACGVPAEKLTAQLLRLVNDQDGRQEFKYISSSKMYISPICTSQAVPDLEIRDTDGNLKKVVEIKNRCQGEDIKHPDQLISNQQDQGVAPDIIKTPTGYKINASSHSCIQQSIEASLAGVPGLLIPMNTSALHLVPLSLHYANNLANKVIDVVTDYYYNTFCPTVLKQEKLSYIIKTRNLLFCCHANCDFTTYFHTQMYIHSKNEHHSGSYKCEFCSRFLSYHKNLLCHKQFKHRLPGNHKEHHCDYCSKFFYTHLKMMEHFLYVHCHIKIFKCKICPKSFGHKHHLIAHSVVHTNPESVLCNKCKSSFNSIDECERHKSTCKGPKNSIEKVQCDECGKKISKKNISAHKKMHQNQIFACTHPHCTKSYKLESALKKHVRLYHTEEGILSRTCEHCHEVLSNVKIKLYHEKKTCPQRPR